MPQVGIGQRAQQRPGRQQLSWCAPSSTAMETFARLFSSDAV